MKGDSGPSISSKAALGELNPPAPKIAACTELVFRLRQKNFSRLHFVLASLSFLIFTLLYYTYLDSFTYVVVVNGREAGLVDDPAAVDQFVTKMNNSISELYELEVAVCLDVEVYRDRRPGASAEPDTVLSALRNEISLLAGAYLISVNGENMVPIANPKDLDRVLEQLFDLYNQPGSAGTVLSIDVVEEIHLQPCMVPPEQIVSVDEAVRLLVGVKPELTGSMPSADAWAHNYENAERWSRSLHSRNLEHDTGRGDVEPVTGEVRSAYSARQGRHEPGLLSVLALEEQIEWQEIPYSTKYVYDDDLWVVQEEVIEQGRAGSKEIVYHVKLKNGQEIGREIYSSRIVEEPRNALVARGTARVPAMGTGRFVWPVEDGGRITPGRGFSSWHTGIDIDTDAGVNVLAADDGIIWYAGYGPSQGNYIVIYHGRYWTVYLHNQANLVRPGDSVNRGEVIARVGSTGRSTGPHLHFEVRLDDGTGEWITYSQHEPIDPLQFFRPR